MTNSLSFDVVIPARFSSSRLPGKPLADIAGSPMIEHVYRRALQSSADRVVVATDDERVAEAVRAFGGDVCMTSPDHASGTDRLQEVATILGLSSDRILVNVQGDEPLIPPKVIDQVAANLSANPRAGVATLAEPIKTLQDFHNPNIVKVVAAESGLARYFSRAPVPWPRDAFSGDASELPAGLNARRHIGIYAYRVALLNRFVSWPVAPLEQFEALEQLRFLYHDENIHVADACDAVPGGVDTEADLHRMRELLG
ncbi:3-deoxy-manno-octulosonate cytidylyltransferase [Microbulbifer thermotolerans]|uniref:3-deoxy-manno-octulosonate cytidylyltransferase n=1 Tax=Microbulbifer thermotolerans TaxID=252514 RepID=UPI00224B2072|nr:3-deoxy-manno-octulosonate cytidylyltransferase [Microbulbifer thermotolerans]MCX2779757.1 3-deoxy-manno-octulosonate cytidylyltransferase [Microbulbifer thermotolerans]MCX2805072.1 3-deoxy-manno-octulosonate cytidylyltransferase [Microbulbifer thermotolerans]MCX2840183.1 3-deoxy-manno-octulosonate cytidylyltransferase [Microbulbifer thermotolerans]